MEDASATSLHVLASAPTRCTLTHWRSAPPCGPPQMRNLGVDLPYSFMTDAKPADPRFAETPEEVAYWDQVGWWLRLHVPALMRFFAFCVMLFIFIGS